MNCSQKLISLIFGTTRCREWEARRELWIALKSWYLWYSEQLKAKSKRSKQCCELLSKVDIFDIRNNQTPSYQSFCLVVNCSQKLISLIFGTTNKRLSLSGAQLWIALKSWYLWYSEQHKTYFFIWILCCELLSKVDIFDIRNNNG